MQSTSPNDDALTGVSRVLVFAYGVLGISAGVRAIYQDITKWSEAPLAYTLTTIAALIYVIACVGFGRRSPQAWRVTFAICVFELVGVVIVGLLTIIERSWFPSSTVWSTFGIGYGFTPLILPALGIWWLTRPPIRVIYGLPPS